MQRPFVETTFVEPTLCGRAHCVFQCPNSGGSIYVGPQHVAGMRYLDELQAAGITGIVNCTESFPNYHEAAIEYCRVAVSDEAGANILIYLDGATSFIQRHLVAGNSCLVHCQMGISRSATIVLANLLRYQEMNLQQAYTHVKERRPLINPNTGFWKQLIVYQTRIRDASNSSVSETPILFDVHR